MRIESLLTIASITFFFLLTPQITRAQQTNLNFSHTANEFAQSTINKPSARPNQSKSTSTVPSEIAKMGMYNAVMSALSTGDGRTARPGYMPSRHFYYWKDPLRISNFMPKALLILCLGMTTSQLLTLTKPLN